MTASVEIQNMLNQTTYNRVNSSTKNEQSDKDMFLSLMLQQMQNQDPTEPMDNQQWLSQLAQYSSLEQMQNMNDTLGSLTSSLSSMSSLVEQSTGITQTLSLIGQEVDIVDPEDATKTITGTVDEATFTDGEGKISVGGKYYPISYVVSVRDAKTTTGTTSSI